MPKAHAPRPTDEQGDDVEVSRTGATWTPRGIPIPRIAAWPRKNIPVTEWVSGPSFDQTVRLAISACLSDTKTAPTDVRT